MMTTKTPVAVLGTGSAGMKHIKAMQSLQYPFYAIPARQDQEQRRANLYGMGVSIADSLTSAYDLGCTHAIIATDSGRHCIDIEEAITIGFSSILVEKPMAINLEEAQHILNIERKYNATVFVASPLRFCKSLTQKFTYALDTVGTLVACHINTFSYLPEWRPERDYHDTYSAKKDQGGVLLDLVHDIDMACTIGSWPMRLQAIVQNQGILGINSPETAHLMWQNQDHCTTVVALSYLHPLIISGYAHRRYGPHPGTREYTIYGATKTERLVLHFSPDDLEQAFLNQDKAFLDPDAEGRAILPTSMDGADTIAIVEAAMRANEMRQEIWVPYLQRTKPES